VVKESQIFLEPVIPSREDGEGPHIWSLEHTS